MRKSLPRLDSLLNLKAYLRWKESDWSIFFAAYCLLAENYGWRRYSPDECQSQADGGSGMADAVVPLSDDCLGFQICVDCRIYQKAKRHSNRMAFLFLIIDMLVVERYILVCYIIFYRHFAMQRAGYDSLFLVLE